MATANDGTTALLLASPEGKTIIQNSMLARGKEVVRKLLEKECSVKFLQKFKKFRF